MHGQQNVKKLNHVWEGNTLIRHFVLRCRRKLTCFQGSQYILTKLTQSVIIKFRQFNLN